jgi:hypothetical protein
MEFYTYLWLYEDGTVRYVGKGKDNRAYKSSRNHRPPTDRSRIIIQYFATEEDAFEAEKFFIAYYGREDLGLGTLRNHSDGGEGPANPSPETVRKMVESRLGKKLKPHSEASKQKTRNSLLGRKHTEERRRNQSIAHKGKPWTAAQRAAHIPIIHCKRGHELNPENVYLSKNNCRGCKRCQKLRKQSIKEIYAGTSKYFGSKYEYRGKRSS